MAFGKPSEPRKEWSESEAARVLQSPGGNVAWDFLLPKLSLRTVPPLGNSLPSLVHSEQWHCRQTWFLGIKMLLGRWYASTLIQSCLLQCYCAQLQHSAKLRRARLGT